MYENTVPSSFSSSVNVLDVPLIFNSNFAPDTGLPLVSTLEISILCCTFSGSFCNGVSNVALFVADIDNVSLYPRASGCFLVL